MIEVMIAVLLTAVATSGIIGLYVATTRSSGFSRHVTEATILAQDGMERARTAPLPATLPSSISETGLDEHGASGGMFDRTTDTTDTTAGYAELVVTVSWTEDGVSRSVVLRSRRNK